MKLHEDLVLLHARKLTGLVVKSKLGQKNEQDMMLLSLSL